MEALYTFDLGILLWIQEHVRCGLLDVILPAISTMGNSGLIWILFATVLAISPKTRKLGLAMALCLLLEYTCNDLIIKPLVHRSRPFVVYPGMVELLISAPHGYSFASGHTTAAFAAITSLYCRKSKLWIPALVLGAVIAFSRLYLFVHFPTDVFGGCIIGILAGLAGSAIFKKIEEKKAS